MTSAEKAAAAAARAAEARRVTAASLTQGELAALLKNKQDESAVANAAAEVIPRPALPYRSCLVPCYLIAPTSSPLEVGTPVLR